MAYWHQTCSMGSLHQDAAWDCYPGVCDQGQGHWTLLKIEILFSLNNFSLFWPIDTKLGACNWCNQNNRIIFSSLPSFISYSCHINTWLKRWKPGFVALRRFLLLLSRDFTFFNFFNSLLPSIFEKTIQSGFGKQRKQSFISFILCVCFFLSRVAWLLLFYCIMNFLLVT